MAGELKRDDGGVAGILAELRQRFDADPTKCGPTAHEIEIWSRQLTLSGFELFQIVGIELAVGFVEDRLGFEFCAVISRGMSKFVFSDFVKNKAGDFPPIFWEVFLAFDAGEFYHDANRVEEPIQGHTRPEIARIVARSREVSASQD